MGNHHGGGVWLARPGVELSLVDPSRCDRSRAEYSYKGQTWPPCQPLFVDEPAAVRWAKAFQPAQRRGGNPSRLPRLCQLVSAPVGLGELR
jgi:hypothetical protein